MTESLNPPIYMLNTRSLVEVDYEWDQWDPYQSVGKTDLRLQALLRSVSDRAKLAFAIGCAEWVVGRLDPWLEGDQRPWLFIEALWAFEMSNDFALPAESDETEWQGQVRGAVDLALMSLLNVVFGWEDDNAEVDAAFIAALAMHVQFDKPRFRHWRFGALQRLRKNYRFDPDNRLGPPVPREALIVTNRFDPQSLSPLASIFVSKARAVNNPFLVDLSVKND